MVNSQLLLVAGTHGNEINAPLLFKQWRENPDLINKSNLKIIQAIGNPLALQQCKRYIDRDLNRSFLPDLINSSSHSFYEAQRAKELIIEYGPDGINPCKIAIDLHTTTAAMGSSLVIYGRRPADLALASLMQFRLGIPVYLHEDDSSEKGFLVESWPCGLVVEIGPVAQSLIHQNIIDKYKIILEACFNELSKVLSDKIHYPKDLIVYSHMGSIDFPRDLEGNITSSIHPDLLGNDWQIIDNNSPLFVDSSQKIMRFDKSFYNLEEDLYALFINEAAYVEKRIAMSITKREKISIKKSWQNDLHALLN